MALEFYIPPCILTPAHECHLPPLERPLRIQVDGPLTAVQKLTPGASWHIERHQPQFPMPGGIQLAKAAYRAIYGINVRPDVARDLVVRDQYLGWVDHTGQIDHYAVSFDHLVPADDPDPDILMINMIEVDYDEGEYANKYLLFPVNSADYTGKKVLAVPRCCQKRKGTQDRKRINDEVIVRESDDALAAMIALGWTKARADDPVGTVRA